MWRSSTPLKDETFHIDNVNDLQEIYEYLASINLTVGGVIGHSYGAKILFDFLKNSGMNILAIFVSTANSIYTPRLNNLNMDLAYLKKIDSVKYQEAIAEMEIIDLETIWKITEKLASLLQENKDRHFYYWANLSIFRKVQEIQGKINLPVNPSIFEAVRKDLYSNASNLSVDINSIETPHIWINGFQDYIMGEPANGLSEKSKIILFLKSSHYPHIEENFLFCETVNAFFKNI